MKYLYIPQMLYNSGFRLTEAGYTTVRILQQLPSLVITTDEKIVGTGKERQIVTLALLIGDDFGAELQ